MNYPKATCDPGTVALRLANERADRWKARHDALAARLASVEAVERVLAAHYPVGYTCGHTCDHNLNSPQGWAAHVTTLILAALASQEQP